MSHIVAIRTQVKDPVAVASACRRLQLPEPEFGTARLYNSEARGIVITLPNWQYPIVCDTATGELHYDNFKGRWGDESHLHHFLQAYAVEKATLEARRQGHSVHESLQEDGTIRLRLAIP
jgi:hypothetical protein